MSNEPLNLEHLPGIKKASENLMQELEQALTDSALNQAEIEQHLAYFVSGFWNQLENRIVAKGLPSRARFFKED